ncbi:MAG TPA: hypothetical protein VKU00_02730 [Chthonomonadaceae bacterium]|nr:hypothetical protein [Chthonomonadaceae bacterium]
MLIPISKAAARWATVAVIGVLVGVSTATAQEEGKWAFDPARDTFSPNALLDLRSLNEKTAGESGFVQRTADGDFALGNGKPVRFWAVDEYVQNVEDKEALPHKARWLAKRGVNMVRVHSVLAPEGDNSKITDVKVQEIDHIWRLVAEMKKQGIYTTVSPYWAIPVKVRASWGVPGGAQDGAALLFWDKTLQAGYKSWLRALYARPNPYTGTPLAQDPSVAIIQLQNEDSMLFWSIQGIKGAQLAELETLYGDWLKQKYGTLDGANQAWGGEHPGPGDFQDNQGDDPANGRMGIYIVWHLTQNRTGYQGKRLADQLAFMTETMRKFNADMAAYLRNTLGCKQLINAGNWRPADPIKLFDAERYSYTPNEVMGVNRYFTGEHQGPDNGWAIRAGDHFTNASVLLDPRGMPTNVKQPVGYPFIIPETEWVAPNAYQSEGPFLTAAYESLTGVDISYFFADGDLPEWQPPFIPLPWNPPTGKWNVATPMQLGQFPAAALLFRQGYLQKGRPVVHEERSVEDIWQRRSPLIAEEGGFDPNRDAGDLPPRSAVKAGVDPMAFLVGPVEVKYDGDAAKSSVVNLSPYIDHADKVVKSITGEVKLNYGIGFCTVNAPKAQGATGFLKKAGPLTLGDITLRSSNDYASVLVVSMDGLPLRTSKKVLVQVGTVARPTGWQDKEATWKSGDGKQTFTGREIVATGRNPWQVLNTEVTLTVKNPGLKTATLLDANGEAVRTVPVTLEGGSLTLKLPANTLYLVLQ